MEKRSVVCIDLDAAASNVKAIRKKVNPNAIIMAIVKADAYGHGAVEYGKVCLENGATYLGVALTDEGIELRQNDIDAPILLLGFTPENEFKYIIEYNLTQTIYSYEMAYALNNIAKKYNKIVNIHIKLETGMSRLGFLDTVESLDEIEKIYKELNYLNVEGIFTHLATSDSKDKTYTYEQKKIFDDFYSKLEEKGISIPIRHIANSGAIIDMDDTNYNLVRPGIIIYGFYPSGEVHKELIDLKPALTWKSSLSYIKTLPKGATLGYGQTYKLEKDTVVGTVPVGYGDGYSRQLSNEGKVLLNGYFAPIIGRVCMDQMMIDIGHIPNPKVGDEIVLIGSQKNNTITADEMATWRDTIVYEVTCNISRRVPREYYKNNKLTKTINRLVAF